MNPRGPSPFGGGSEDPIGDGEGGPGGDDPIADTSVGGWVPPEARVWRHPSEVAGGPAATAWPAGGWGVAAGNPSGGGRLPRHLATGLIAAGAAAAVMAGVLLLFGTGSGPGTSGNATAPTLAEASGCCRYVPSTARQDLEAMVSLQVSTDHGVVQECGVAVASGGLVATTLDAVAGASSITAVTAGGRRERAVVVATDRPSDVALLRVDGPLPVARFAGAVPPSGDGEAMVVAMAVTASGSRSPGLDATAMWSDSVVRSAGDPIARGDASGMVGIDAVSPAMPTMGGEVLVGANGRVLGLLDASASSPQDEVFLPAPLVVGVARSLATTGRVRHGWLDVVGEDAADEAVTEASGSGTGTTVTTTAAEVRRRAGGALVVKVEPAGASADVLRPGDVIVSLDDRSLSSMADLRSRLYLMRPGARVELGIVRGDARMTVAVHLSASP